MKENIKKMANFLFVVQISTFSVYVFGAEECSVTQKSNYQEALDEYINKNRPILKQILHDCKASVESIQNEKEACDSGRSIKSICSDSSFSRKLNVLMDRCVLETSKVIGAPPESLSEVICSDSVETQARMAGGRSLESEFKPQFNELIGLAQRLLFLLR